MERVVSAFAPVNIAWIKYMGKVSGAPANSSFSLTLKNTGTEVRMTGKGPFAPNVTQLQINFENGSYVPPHSGKEKLLRFFGNAELWRSCLERFDYPVQFPSAISVFTKNNAPAASGIATSASSFAAMTLAYAAVLVGEKSTQLKKQFVEDKELRKALAAVSAKGSGSSCRSFLGPWVEWNPESGITKFKEAADTEWMDLIFLIDSEPKTVSSSEAHERVSTSPLYSGRPARAEKRLKKLKELLPTHEFSELSNLVWEESQDMHELFHTSQPAFRYQTDESIKIADSILKGEGPSRNAVLTQDAGANLHVFVPKNELTDWRAFAQKRFPEISIIEDEQGTGAYYAE